MDLRVHLCEGTAASREAHARLVEMPAQRRDELARIAQARTSELGLMRGAQAIPLVLSPVALPREELTALGRAARLIVSALVKVCRELIEKFPDRAHVLFDHLSPLEEEALRTRWREAEELLIARVDWFVDASGRPRTLEVNATIPAMPVYSDAAALGWLAAWAPSRVEDLFARSHSNAGWLADGLITAAKRARRQLPLRAQLLHRPRDPQLPELVALAQLLLRRGCAEARTCTPDDVVLDGDSDRVIYRHIFARYLEPGTALARAFLDPIRHGMWNRVDAWLETKALVAELSLRAGSDSLTPDERDAVRSLVPWTRLLDDVSDAELGTGAEYILKRSHDYGGKSVVIGREAGPDGFRAALAAARRDPAGSWVAQELIDSPAMDRWFAVHTPGESVRAGLGALHVDVSTYASLVEGVPSGGSVCRAAPGRVVNIAGGGGVAPLYPEDVLQEALDAAR
jgi:hypothetical protein